jgi:hypothetical protein
MPTNHTPAVVLFLAACAAAAPYHTNLSPALAPLEQDPRALFVGDSLTLAFDHFHGSGASRQSQGWQPIARMKL